MLDTVTTPDEEQYQQACAIVTDQQKCSTSFIQRSLSIGYNKAARIVERMEAEGLISAADHVGKREIHGTKNAFDPSPKVPPERNPRRRRCARCRLQRDRRRAPPVHRTVRASGSREERLAEQQKDVMSEAKARGYDTKVLKKIIALRKRDKDDIAEEEAILELYKTALGMS